MTAAKSSAGTRELKTFAWQGIRLTIPSDWELVSTHGNWDAGFVALADSSATRLQVKWEQPRGEAVPAEVVASYIKKLTKDAKRDKTDIKVNRQLKLASLKDKEIECYEWEAADSGTGMVSRCETCGRMAHVLVTGQRGESLHNLSRTVFGSLRDHPEDGLLAWDFFDLRFNVPDKMRLARQDLKTGCIRMLFRQKSGELEVVRVSLARVLLAKKSLAEWLCEFYAPELKRHKTEISECSLKAHPALRMAARPWLITDPARLIGRRRETRIACWHCEKSNRLFVVRHQGRPEGKEILEKTLESVECCQSRA